MPDQRAPSHDERWGGSLPWSLRHSTLSTKGDYRRFLEMLSEQLYQLILHNDAQIPNLSQFGSRLAAESLMRYRHNSEPAFAIRIKKYFSPDTLDSEAETRSYSDAEVELVSKCQHEYNQAVTPGPGYRPLGAQKLLQELQVAQVKASLTKQSRIKNHWHQLLLDRFEVLQSLLKLLAKHGDHSALDLLQYHIRRFAADTGVQINIKGNPPEVFPLEEPLLQKEVLDKLLPRLEEKFPDRARDITGAYHDLLKGTDTNKVFGDAFKALEELAREISGNRSLLLSDRLVLGRHFPKLHGTILDTIVKLAGHRGDEGGHGRKGPDEWEIRYLLLAICNTALLLLEYKEHCG